MESVLLTGAAGFIGSHLVDFLLEKGYKVYGIDNFLTSSLDNINHNLNSSNFKFINADISERLNFEEKVDYVLHFASPASPKDYLKYPIQTLKVGALGTLNALGIARKNNAKFLLASTSEVYGDPLIHPQPETYYGNVNPIGPRGVYDEAKRFAESLSFAYHRQHKMNIKVARIFNTYGERMRLDDGRVIPSFISSALKNQPLIIYGDGKQTRCFCYISDLIKGIYQFMLSDYSGVINIGDTREITIGELANVIIRMTGSKSPIIHNGKMEDDPQRRKPDITKAKQILNWQPETSFEDGLRRTIEYIKSRMH
ncbi:MAG: UDP-glucuronic acid decarboxylase family protein [Planctomycetota bacterium]